MTDNFESKLQNTFFLGKTNIKGSGQVRSALIWLIGLGGKDDGGNDDGDVYLLEQHERSMALEDRRKL